MHEKAKASKSSGLGKAGAQDTTAGQHEAIQPRAHKVTSGGSVDWTAVGVSARACSFSFSDAEACEH